MRLKLINEKRKIITRDKDSGNRPVPSIAPNNQNDNQNNKLTHRGFLKKTVAAAASVNPLIKFLVSGGMPATVVSALESGKTIPFLMTAVSNPGRGIWDNLSTAFDDVSRVSALSRRISDEGLIFGADEDYFIGGRIGLDKIMKIANAARRGSTVILGGMEYKVTDGDNIFWLNPVGGNGQIRIYKKEDDYKSMLSFEPLDGNVIKQVWEDYLKYGGSVIDNEAKKIIKNYNLDMSQWQDDIPNDIPDDEKKEEQQTKKSDKESDFASEYHGSMHQMYENFNNKLNIILDRI